MSTINDKPVLIKIAFKLIHSVFLKVRYVTESLIFVLYMNTIVFAYALFKDEKAAKL